jgi:hypothetical protein
MYAFDVKIIYAGRRERHAAIGRSAVEVYEQFAARVTEFPYRLTVLCRRSQRISTQGR